MFYAVEHGDFVVFCCRTPHGVRGLKYVKGDDIVVESSSGEFVTILKGGVTNARVKNARKSKI